MKNYRVYLYTFLAMLPILLLRDYTPANELRYLSIADEALRNGTFLTFYNHDQIYADKPPLYFWIIMLGKWIFGAHHMWFLSLFSLLPAFIICRTMDRWIAEEIKEEYRPTGGWLLLTCGLFMGMAIFLRMDMLMCMFITLSLATFYKMVQGQGNPRRNSILFPLYIFLALFSKGPIGLLIPLTVSITFLGLTGRIRSIGRYWGWKTGVILIGCAALWFGGVYYEGGQTYLHNLLFHQTIDRAVNSFHHEAPFYYYFISIWYSLIPWSLFLIGIICYAIYKRLLRSEIQKFFLTTIGVSFLLLSLISSKIEVYLLPVFPFIVYLALTVLPLFKWNHWLALSLAIPASIFALALPGWIIVQTATDLIPYQENTLFYAAAGLLSSSGLYALYQLYRRKQIKRTIHTLAYGLLSAIFIGGWNLPEMNKTLGYGHLCEKGQQIAQKYQLKNYYVWKIYRSENMDVYLQQKVQAVSPEETNSLEDGILLLPTKRLNELPQNLLNKERVQTGTYTIIVIR